VSISSHLPTPISPINLWNQCF